MGRLRRERSLCPSCSTRVEARHCTFCSNACHQEYLYRAYIARWQAGLESGNIGKGRGLGVSARIRRYLIAKHGEWCTRCGWAERNPVTGRVPLNIEHLDGNPFHSVEANLTLLCPNCHSLTPTYGALNKGNGRVGRGRPAPVKASRAPRVPKPRIVREATQWPSNDDLGRLVQSEPMSHIAATLNVSGTAVKNRCKSRGILTPPSGYWSKSRSQTLRT